MIVLGGGNTTYLMNKVIDSGFDKEIKKLAKTKVIVGISAGSIALAEKIWGASENLFKGTYNDSPNGIGLTKINTRTHYLSKNSPKYTKDNISAATKNSKYKLYGIDDNTAIKIIDDEIEVISEGKWDIFPKKEKCDIIIVDENDRTIGYKERGTLEQKDIYRVSALWITNSKGNILLAQRAFTKDNDPGIWGPAVAGTIDEGESYESNIIKEAEEEIGLRDVSFKKEFKAFREGKHRHFTQWFSAVVDKEIDKFVIQENEVEQIRWFSKEELLIELKKNPEKFLKSIKELITKFNQ